MRGVEHRGVDLDRSFYEAADTDLELELVPGRYLHRLFFFFLLFLFRLKYHRLHPELQPVIPVRRRLDRPRELHRIPGQRLRYIVERVFRPDQGVHGGLVQFVYDPVKVDVGYLLADDRLAEGEQVLKVDRPVAVQVDVIFLQVREHRDVGGVKPAIPVHVHYSDLVRAYRLVGQVEYIPYKGEVVETVQRIVDSHFPVAVDIYPVSRGIYDILFRDKIDAVMFIDIPVLEVHRAVAVVIPVFRYPPGSVHRGEILVESQEELLLKPRAPVLVIYKLERPVCR